MRRKLRVGRQSADAALSNRSPLHLLFFGKLFERDLRRSFHAVRCSGEFSKLAGPLVIFANHPSWWDGELFVWLTATMFADRRVLTPIDARMLERYPFFRRLGAFAVLPGFAGASAFHAATRDLLALDDGLLLINAEGRFRDGRDRPLHIMSNLAHVARHTPLARFVPLAIEYAFWDERRPNLLLRFGDAVPADLVDASGVALLAEALTVTMDRLAADAASREAGRFATLLSGRTTINPFYDGWRHAKGLLRGRRFNPTHSPGADN